MTLKLSKTAVRELKRFYRAILMGIIISGFISVSANATVSIDDGAGGTVDVYTADEVDDKLTNINIGTDQIVNGSVSTNDLANKAVTSEKIDTSAVGQNHIADAAVGTDELIDKSVTTSKLDDTLQTNIKQIGTNTSAIAENKGAIDILNGTKQDKLSDAQMNAVNSGITTDKVDTYDAYADKINANAAGIAANTASIAANTAAINQNKSEINANKTAISTNAAGIAANTASITANTAAINQNKSEINANKTAISANAAEIAALKVGKANAADVYTKSEINAQITETKADASAKANAALTDAKDYTDALADGAVKTNTEAIATLNGTGDGSVAKQVNTALTEAKDYTDTLANGTVKNNTNAIAVLNGDETVDGSVAKQVNTALTEAKDYTDTLANGTVKNNTDAIVVLNGDETVDGSVANIASGYAKTAETNANAYTDAQDAATLASAKTYAEEKANTAETNAKTYAKSYTDTLIGSTDDLVEQNGVMKVNTVNQNITALNNKIGNITNLNQYAEGTSIGNALTQGGTQSADTVVAALNNIDATLGTIHGLRDKLAASGAGTNLASGTTVEQHLTALDSAIGNRAYTSTRYISSGSDLSTAVSALDSNLSRVEGNLDALTNRTNKMHHEMKSGFASLAAMSALVPNARVAGDTQISVGTGHYRGTTGFALGAFHHVNDNVLLNAGAAYGGNGSATFKGGVTFGW